MTQTPDTKTGNYYVTVVDATRYVPLAGPFKNDHAAALAMVDAAKAKAFEVDPRAPFYSYGTARMPDDFTKPGLLNQALGLEVN